MPPRQTSLRGGGGRHQLTMLFTPPSPRLRECPAGVERPLRCEVVIYGQAQGFVGLGCQAGGSGVNAWDLRPARQQGSAGTRPLYRAAVAPARKAPRALSEPPGTSMPGFPRCVSMGRRSAEPSESTAFLRALRRGKPRKVAFLTPGRGVRGASRRGPRPGGNISQSRLDRFRAELVAMRQAGASCADVMWRCASLPGPPQFHR